MWQLGERLAGLSKPNSPLFGAQSIQLNVYKVSYCIEGQDCAVPYLDSSATGIRPFLYFYFYSGPDAQHTIFAYQLAAPR